jgi:Spy/CpxP family protein refolding chaperone
MKTTTRIIAATIASLALGATGLAFAHAGMGPGDMGRMGAGMGMGMQGGGHGGMHGMHGMRQAADPIANLATVKTELKISAAQ